MKVQGNNGDSVFLLRPENDIEVEWIEENVEEGEFDPGYPNVVIVEHRYLGVIVNGIIAAGFYVEMGGAS